MYGWGVEVEEEKGFIMLYSTAKGMVVMLGQLFSPQFVCIWGLFLSRVTL